MASPSPSPRRTSPSAPSRNLSSGSSRTELFVPRGLQQNFHTTSSNFSENRALHENVDDHKENSTENGNIRGTLGRANQNLKGPSKKPWVTHFAKPATRLFPSNTVLVDRNSSCSPLRMGSTTASRNGENLTSDKKIARSTTPTEQREAPPTPGPVKDVAELSKRIQQFLENQNVLLGVKTGGSHDATFSRPSVTPVEPYNPYKSPFSERPKFLRLNGNVLSPLEGADIIAPSMDGVDMLIKTTMEEASLPAGDQVLLPRFQQIQSSISLSPSSIGDKDVGLAENIKEKAVVDKGAAVDALDAKVLLIPEGAATYLHESKAEAIKERTEKAPEEDDEARAVQTQNDLRDGETPRHAQDQQGEDNVIENIKEKAIVDEGTAVDAFEAKVLLIPESEGTCLHELKAEATKERTEKVPEEDDETRAVQTQSDFRDREAARQAQNQRREDNVTDVEAKKDAVSSTLQEAFRVIQNQDANLSVESTKTNEVLDGVDRDDVSWGEKTVRVMFCGSILAAFLALVLLSSASPGLLPPSLVNNPINSFWESCKYHEHYVTILRGMDGLWSSKMMHFSADAHVAVFRGVELFQGISELFKSHQELQLYFQVASSILDDWGRVLVQHLSLTMDPDTTGEREDRARQIERIQDYEIDEKDWLDEILKLPYTDWELLYEYDLGAANQFVLGSIPESLKNEMWRNFSRLSDSPEVRNLLEDLMKLKGGSTEDRLEVLQYFWQYRRFSASAHESLMKFQTTAFEDSHSEHPEVEFNPEGIEIDHDQTQEKMESDKYMEEHHQISTEEHFKHLEDSQLDELAGHRVDKVGIEAEQISPESSETGSENLQESMVSENSEVQISTVYEDAKLDEVAEHCLDKVGTEHQIVPEISEMVNDNSHSVVSVVYENDASWTDSLHELQREVGNVDTSSTGIQPIESTSDVKFETTQLATLATFIVASFFILGRNRQSKNVPKVNSHASSIQFLRKSDQRSNNLHDETQQNMPPSADAKQNKKKAIMIEELNDRLESVLQSLEPNNLHQRSSHARKDEDLIRSPVPISRYGSFTTYKLMSKKEGQAVETKLTPVRRSTRIRNHVDMSQDTNRAKPIAISPP